MKFEESFPLAEMELSVPDPLLLLSLLDDALEESIEFALPK